MLEITSTSWPSTPAALVAKSRCRGVPRAARRNTTAAISRATTANASAITGLTVPISTIATPTARQGGRVFQAMLFSVWNTALEVAVMRLASVPGRRSEK